MRFFEILKSKKIFFFQVFLTLYITINLVGGERGLISYFEKKNYEKKLSIKHAELEKVLISPAQHQLHHSLDERHYDKNFGAALAIWDWIFGSLHHSEDIDNLVLGVEDDDFNPKSIKELYLKPLKEIINILSESLSGFKSLNKIFKI